MPRKADASSSAVTAQSQQDAVSEGIENFELPRSLVTKLARSGMSENTKMQRDVVLSFQKASTVFINYLAAAAHEISASKQHKSISASDVLQALKKIDMGDMGPILERELQVYREIQKAEKNKKGGSSAKVKAREPQANSDRVPASISAATAMKSKSKGKEREKGPTITINRAQMRAKSEAQAQQEQGHDLEQEAEGESDEEQVDEEGEEEQAVEEGDEEMLEVEDDVEDEDEDEEGIEDEEDGGAHEDLMAVEDEEIKRDTRVLEEDDDE